MIRRPFSKVDIIFFLFLFFCPSYLSLSFQCTSLSIVMISSDAGGGGSAAAAFCVEWRFFH